MVGTEERTGGGERTASNQYLGVVCWISHRNHFTVAGYSVCCYGFGEMPAPNHKGLGISGGSHGDDTESDGASLTGPQPYSEGDKREFPRYAAGSL
jgi:hypothetical protein